MIVVFLTFNPLFDANILDHINDMISSLCIECYLKMYITILHWRQAIY